MSESWLENKAVKFAETDGHLCRKVAYIGRKSAPDRWFLKDGVWRLVEFKAWGEEPTALQAREHKRLRDHGAEVHVIDNFEEFVRVFT